MEGRPNKAAAFPWHRQSLNAAADRAELNKH